MESKPTVSVVVSELNSARTIGNSLRALLSQDYPEGLYDITVVDGGSDDGSQAIIRDMQDPRVKLVEISGCSEAEGQSIGVNSSTGEIIMFTNSDIYVPTNWISLHVSWILRGFDLVGGKPFWGGDKYALVWNAPTPSEVAVIQKPGLGLGFSNCSVRRRMFFEVGGIRNLRSQHDTEFVFRAQSRGVRLLLDPHIEVYHDHPFKSWPLSFTRSYGYARNHTQVMKLLYGRVVSGSGYAAMLSLGYLLKDVLGVNSAKAFEELRRKSLRKEEQIGLFSFIFWGFISKRLGQYLGILVGTLRRDNTERGLLDLHMQIERAGTGAYHGSLGLLRRRPEG